MALVQGAFDAAITTVTKLTGWLGGLFGSGEPFQKLKSGPFLQFVANHAGATGKRVIFFWFDVYVTVLPDGSWFGMFEGSGVDAMRIAQEQADIHGDLWTMSCPDGTDFDSEQSIQGCRFIFVDGGGFLSDVKDWVGDFLNDPDPNVPTGDNTGSTDQEGQRASVGETILNIPTTGFIALGIIGVVIIILARR